ncbi:iron-containing alcohol dehydrogenase [Hugenholtzia roseola]|uniref:iron-containing alcohol dehydrogenase n=1 Tax=Hugenholtzia roseola TaxID=1002 RepID=UPI0004147D0A|nr:iron-containing alcohol dehydrogenase [Hugenholtzia roseola]
MRDFSIYVPTRIFFGENQLDNFATAASTLGKKALLVMGGGSIERLGFLAPFRAALEKVGVETVLFSGIEPNPQARTINKAASLAQQEKVDFVIGFGGGSVLDASKAIAILVHEKAADIWQYVLGEPKMGAYSGAIPVVAVPTTAATASEVTQFAVISNEAVHGKSVLAHDVLRPRLALMNPLYTATLSRTVTEDGAADILSHVFENYILGGSESPLADRYSEAVILTVLETLPKLRQDLQNVKYRADLFWASDLALNGYQLAGRNPSEFVLHSIEHAASGFYPQLAHGRGLATLYPAYFRWLWKNDRAKERFAQLAERVFGVKEGDTESKGQAFIEHFENWLAENGLLQSFPAVGVEPQQYQAIAEYATKIYGDGKKLNALGDLTVANIVEILEMTHSQEAQLA